MIFLCAPGRWPTSHGEVSREHERERQHTAHLERIHRLERDRDNGLLDFSGCQRATWIVGEAADRHGVYGDELGFSARRKPR